MGDFRELWIAVILLKTDSLPVPPLLWAAVLYLPGAVAGAVLKHVKKGTISK